MSTEKQTKLPQKKVILDNTGLYLSRALVSGQAQHIRFVGLGFSLCCSSGPARLTYAALAIL